ncbi:NADH-quinone oxidoreductase subunit D [Fervidicoccus fontis]|uniref:NADH-quinone oxidoreductase subunit D n=1 Tax=Fervidicoccus fontis TaxID=683846 RepID=A0A843A7Q3_9CREN|nr:NADH-quinone oxidoreductase subunit D [Fervidicoccus fontis]MBE9390715.1 NADH-quinone oxidoreductase subunit D [Fervidicoccus fontis]
MLELQIENIQNQFISTRKIDDNTMVLFIGPQHPSSGHMRFIVKVDGDIVTEVDPDIGYVHRTMEKLSETKEWVKNTVLFERLAILDAGNISLGYVLALEKLLGIDVPPRALYLRTILSEINRIASHLYGMGILAIMLGSSTGYMWFFGDREVPIELAERMSGARLTHSYHIPGGVRRDVPKDFFDELERGISYIERRLKEYEIMFVNNPVIRSRLENVGVMSKEMAVSLGVVGPNLRASGVSYDVRVEEPYNAYTEIDFEVPIYKEGDCLARVMQRVDEIRQSISMLRQLSKKIPDGPIFNEKYMKQFTKIMKDIYDAEKRVKLPASFLNLKPQKGTAYSRIEASRGELFYYIESSGDLKPYRVRVVTPSFRNSIILKYLPVGYRLADLVAIYGSIDYFPPEADR